MCSKVGGPAKFAAHKGQEVGCRDPFGPPSAAYVVHRQQKDVMNDITSNLKTDREMKM